MFTAARLRIEPQAPPLRFRSAGDELSQQFAEIDRIAASWGPHPLPAGPWLGLRDSIHAAFKDEDR